MSSSAIAASGLREACGDKTVLDGIDLNIGAGTIFSLLGPNGAGKTTTVNVLTTLLKAGCGTARVAGHDIATGTEAVRAAIGVDRLGALGILAATSLAASWLHGRAGDGGEDRSRASFTKRA